MSAEPGADSAAPNLNLTPDEKRAYGQLFRQADADNVGVVTGETAVKFFDRTRLDSRVLGEIWQIADKENRGFLTPSGFGIVLRLIGHAQAGREPTAEVALQPGPLPRFDGFFTQPAGQPSPASPPPPSSPIQAQGTGGTVRIPPLSPDKVAQFTGLFERQPLQTGNLLPGDQARRIFDKSGLPNEVLSKIWELADTEQRGALVQTEFIIAMHLLTSMKTGALRSLPNLLPAALYEAATLRGPAPRQSPNNTGMSAIPRQLSGSAQMRTGSPLGRPPIRAQTTGAASEWAVTPADKARFDQLYADLDKTNKGCITGEEAVPFLSQSSLSEDALAQIWDLADYNSQGTLTREGFAIAMYLIRQQRSGRSTALPSTLPPNLIPPSMRNQARPSISASPFDQPAAPAAPLPPPPQTKSALDDLFGLDSSAPSPAPAASALSAMSTGASNTNDPFGSSATVQAPSSPVRGPQPNTNFKPFVPSSSFGRGLTTQNTGDSVGAKAMSQPSASDDLLGDADPEEANKITGESTDLANLSHQIGSLSKQMQDTKGKRSNTQNELNQANAQKQNFEQRLAQLRTLYEKEAKDTSALEEQLRNSRNETKKLQGECMTLEGTYRDTQTQHQQVLTALQADQKENETLRERIRVINGEIVQLKPQIEKLKSEARQQKGLVAINKKQLSTTEGERDKLKDEAEDLTKSNEEASRQLAESAASSPPIPVASPTLSTSSGNNPFFKRTASTDIMGALASPPARTFSHQSFDEVFGPSLSISETPPPPPAAAFKPNNTGASSTSANSSSTPAVSTPATGGPDKLAASLPPPPPESRQISSSFLPFPEHRDSVSSSRQVSPPLSRAEESGNEPMSPFPGEAATAEKVGSLPGAFPGDALAKEDLYSADDEVKAPISDEATSATGEDATPTAQPGPFGAVDHAKAKADFDDAFAAFTTANKNKDKPEVETQTQKSSSAFNTEFPPISELERDGEDDESDSDTEGNGFDDDFAPVSPEKKAKEPMVAAPGPVATENDMSAVGPPVPAKEPPKETAEKSVEQPSSPATITMANAPAQHGSTVDDIFGTAASGTETSTGHAVPSNPPAKSAFDDLDDDFEGLEDAKEGSADDDFANISRSGLDEFNPVFDSSPPASQTKSESTAFGNESSFDFVPSNSSSGAPAPSSGNQQKGAESHDWDAIFSGLDSPSTTAAPAPPINDTITTPKADTLGVRPLGPGRALTEAGEHDDPMVKELTSMGYARGDVVTALEKYDYNLERAANFLASES